MDKYSLINLLAPEDRDEISRQASNIVFLRAIDRVYNELDSAGAIKFNQLFNQLEDSSYSDEDRFHFLRESMPKFPEYLVEEAIKLRKELNSSKAY